MARLPHLQLIRLDRTEDRRRKPPPPGPPARANPGGHGRRLADRADAAVAEQTAAPRIEGIDPELILKVTLTSPVQEEQLRLAGFRVLSQEPGEILVLFSNDVELRQFRQRLAQYRQGIAPGRRNPAHNALFSAIEDIGSITPSDRIGPRLRANGIAAPADLVARRAYTVDIELWDAPTAMDRHVRVRRIAEHVEGAGGEVLSRYVGNAGLIVLRVKVRGTVLREILGLSVVSRLDTPPIPDLGDRDAPDITVQDLPDPVAPGADTPIIGVIDSGVSDHPLLAPCVVEAVGIPDALGTADIWGHGTKVAGIAAYGDVRECIDTRTFTSPVRIVTAKVVNDQGHFDDRSTIPEQTEAAIRALHDRGCRVINMSLGDAARIPYDGGRLSAWASTLDLLASELDVVIVVSAGNAGRGAQAPWGPTPELVTQRYPAYLVEPSNRIIDPATAAIALTVGSIAHANGLPHDPVIGAELRAITNANTPTPITRSGPGANNAVKPELVDYGGTCLFDGGVQRVVSGQAIASAGMVTLRSDYLEGLFTASTGTSLAAPRIAYKAALLLRAFPQASANLVRALLATAAAQPREALEILDPLGANASLNCLGYGIPDAERALNSEERRVILVADHQELATDQFALYQIPIPDVFQNTRGERHIRVTLAFDPPVRHTRLEYLGLRMNFHLLRGVGVDEIFEHFRRRTNNEDPFEALPAGAKCDLAPSRRARETSTLQSAMFTMKRNVERDRFGDTYYLAVFAERRWAGEEITHQRFAVSVELQHQAEINLYQALRVRLRA